MQTRRRRKNYACASCNTLIFETRRKHCTEREYLEHGPSVTGSKEVKQYLHSSTCYQKNICMSRPDTDI